MKVCVVGAGAIGGLIGGRLALAGEEVTLIDRGPRLESLQSDGLELMLGGERHRVHAFETAAATEEAGPHEIVILSVKSYDISSVAAQLPLLYGPETVVVTVQNGIPWWYFQRHGGALDGRRLETLDPEGLIESNIPPERILGCVPYPAAVVRESGVVEHIEGNGLPVGELDGAETDRARRVVHMFRNAGFKSWILPDVRAEIWLKAWGSLSFNPVSAITGATLEDICRFPDTRDLVRTLMEEARAVCDALEVRVRRTVEERIAGAERVGPHKTSMLQDVERGQRLEVDGLVRSVCELGALTDTPAPVIRAVSGLLALLDRTVRQHGPRHFVSRNPTSAPVGTQAPDD